MWSDRYMKIGIDAGGTLIKIVKGIAESTLRQLPTYIRKHFELIKVLTIILYGEHNELKPLCVNSNFVVIEEAEDYVRFQKYINY